MRLLPMLRPLAEQWISILLLSRSAASHTFAATYSRRFVRQWGAVI